MPPCLNVARISRPGLFFCLICCSISCSAIQRLHPRYRAQEGDHTVKTAHQEFSVHNHAAPGALLVSFESTEVLGDFLVGAPGIRQADPRPSHIPDAFPITIRIVNRGSQSLTLRPGEFRLEKGKAAEPPLGPRVLVESYETFSMAAFPLEFRVVPVRAGLFLEPAPFWNTDRKADTASPAQRHLRLENRVRSLEERFASFTLKSGESAALMLFFRLVPPDNDTSYQLTHPSGFVPPLVFRFETIPTEDESSGEEIQSFARAYNARHHSMERDLQEIYDIHRQLHQHADLIKR